MEKLNFKVGVKDGFPICLGYFSVSFGIGILAVKNGLPAWAAVVISLTNLTSAGEAAGIGVIAAAGSYIELILTQILINCRYSLMGLSLAQNLDESFTLPKRMLASFGITDEIFGVAASKKAPLKASYMAGMICIATAGWVLGTGLGAVSGEILPVRLTQALGILLYGMFIAIIIPPVKQSRAQLIVILIAAAISCIIYFGLPQISSGFAIIISAVIAAAIMAAVAPVNDDEPIETDDSALKDTEVKP